jgi:hypothetical protein
MLYRPRAARSVGRPWARYRAEDKAAVHTLCEQGVVPLAIGPVLDMPDSTVAKYLRELERDRLNRPRSALPHPVPSGTTLRLVLGGAGALTRARGAGRDVRRGEPGPRYDFAFALRGRRGGPLFARA